VKRVYLILLHLAALTQFWQLVRKALQITTVGLTYVQSIHALLISLRSPMIVKGNQVTQATTTWKVILHLL